MKLIKAQENREEYFENPTQDYFNLTKKDLKLIKGVKKGSFLRHVPDHYGPEGSLGYAILRGFNCVAGCHYCYLQSYFKNPDLVKFENWQDYLDFIHKFLIKLREKTSQPVIFYDGDFQDSFSPISLPQDIKQINQLLKVLEQFENVFVEVRTKLSFSKKNNKLQKRFEQFNNLDIAHSSLVVGITFSPQIIVEKFEPGTAKLDERIDFAKYVISRGGKVGIRFDPIILLGDPEKQLKFYIDLLDRLLSELPFEQIWNIGIGTLRLKDSLYKRLKKVGSELVKGLELDDGFWRYPRQWRYMVYEMIRAKVDKIYVCMDS